MIRKKIAVITEDLELASFFELEFSIRGFDVDVFFSLSKIGEGYLLAIVDTDTCSLTESISSYTVSVSSLAQTVISPSRCHLRWPVAISDVDKILDLVMHGKTDDATDTAEGNVVRLIDDRMLTVALCGRTVRLTKNEFAILKILCGASGETVARECIMSVLGAEKGNISDVYIYHLRKKLETNGGKRLIFTDRGKGYRTVLRLCENENRLP